MSQPQNPLSQPGPWSLVAEGYQTETVPFFRQYCQKAIELSGYTAGSSVIDIACGPGTLTLMLADTAGEVTAVDFSEAMLAILRREVKERQLTNVKIIQANAQRLEMPDNLFDFGYSIFGLMFFPDRMAGFRELYRVLKPGKCAAVSSWAPVAESSMMQLLFGSLRAAFPERPEPKTNMLSLENPDFFQQEMQAAGFKNVAVTPFSGELQVDNAEKFLDSMIRGSAPLEMMRKNLKPEVWSEKRRIIQKYIEDNLPPLPVKLHSKAFIATGIK